MNNQCTVTLKNGQRVTGEEYLAVLGLIQDCDRMYEECLDTQLRLQQKQAVYAAQNKQKDYPKPDPPLIEKALLQAEKNEKVIALAAGIRINLKTLLKTLENVFRYVLALIVVICLYMFMVWLLQVTGAFFEAHGLGMYNTEQQADPEQK